LYLFFVFFYALTRKEEEEGYSRITNQRYVPVDTRASKLGQGNVVPINTNLLPKL